MCAPRSYQSRQLAHNQNENNFSDFVLFHTIFYVNNGKHQRVMFRWWQNTTRTIHKHILSPRNENNNNSSDSLKSGQVRIFAFFILIIIIFIFCIYMHFGSQSFLLLLLFKRQRKNGKTMCVQSIRRSTKIVNEYKYKL